MCTETIGTRSTLRSQVRSFGYTGRPKIEIILNGQGDTPLASYTTLEKIEGEVVFTASDVRFDEINISFEGMCFLEVLDPSLSR